MPYDQEMRPRSTLRPVRLTVLILAYVAISIWVLWSNDGNHSERVLGIAGFTYGFIAAFDVWAWPRLETNNGAPEALFLFKPAVAFFVWAAILAAAGVANLFEEDRPAWELLLFLGIAVVLALIGLWWVGRGSNDRNSA